MSLNKVAITEVVKKQFRYKLKANVGVFTSLVILQIIGLLFALGGNGGGSHHIAEVEISYTLYSIYNTIVFITLWALIHATLMTKKNTEDTFSFVANNLTKDLSNIVFLTFASIIAAILTVLSAFSLRVIVHFFIGEDLLSRTTYTLTGGEVLSAIIVMTFILLFVCDIGYFLGTVSRLHSLLPRLLPVVIIGGFIGLERMNPGWIETIISFYYQESNLFLYLLKMMLTLIILFSFSIFLSSRTEVRI